MPENLPRVGSALLVRDEANRILLGQRNKDPQRGAWVIPGGRIHAFESIAQAAAREMEEETGLKVEVGNHFAVYEIINPPNEHRIVIYSSGKVLGGTPTASDDLSRVEWFSVAELGEVPTTPLVQKVLQDAGLLAREAEPAPCPQIQLNLFGDTRGIVAGVDQNWGGATAQASHAGEGAAAVSSHYAQLSLFGESTGTGHERGQALHEIFLEPICTLLGWLQHLIQEVKLMLSTPGGGLRIRSRSVFGGRGGRGVPILLAGASAELPGLGYSAPSKRHPKKREIIKSGLLFDMRVTT